MTWEAPHGTNKNDIDFTINSIRKFMTNSYRKLVGEKFAIILKLERFNYTRRPAKLGFNINYLTGSSKYLKRIVHERLDNEIDSAHVMNTILEIAKKKLVDHKFKIHRINREDPIWKTVWRRWKCTNNY